MNDSTRLGLVLDNLPPRCGELLRHLSTRREPFTLGPALFPSGGRDAWEGAFARLCREGLLERVGWGQAPRFRITPGARQALAQWRQRPEDDVGFWAKRAF
jgi:hypothetical protein